MKRLIFLLMLISFFSSSDSVAADSQKSLKDSVWTIETDEKSADESINRISGEYDRGYSAPEYSFKSPDHTKAGPFGRQEANEGNSSGY